MNQAATEIAQEYLVEIAPYVGGLDLPQFLRRLPGHVLTRDEVETLFDAHNARRRARAEPQHVFCALYRVGLLGYLQPRPGARRDGCSASCGPARGRSSRTASCRGRRTTSSTRCCRMSSAGQSRLPADASTGRTSSATAGPGGRRDAPSRTRHVRHALRAHGRRPGLRRPHAGRRRRARPPRARGGGAEMGQGRRLRRDRRRRRGADRFTTTRSRWPGRARHLVDEVYGRPGSPACGSPCTTARC